MAVSATLLGADFQLTAVPLAAFVLLLGVASGHAVGILAASVKVIAKRGDPIIGLYSLATGLLAGTTFPVQLLPVPLRVLSYCLPPTYVISALRRILMPEGDSLSGPTALQAILMLLVFLAIVYPLALWLYGRSLEFGRKMGLLAGY
jgi:ABC-2 type transport system permease protein